MPLTAMSMMSAPAAAFASSTAWRRLFAPLSFVLVTVNVAPLADVAQANPAAVAAKPID